MAIALPLSSSPAPSLSAEHHHTSHRAPSLQSSFPYRISLSVSPLHSHFRSLTIGTIGVSRLGPLSSATATQGPVAADSSSALAAGEEESEKEQAEEEEEFSKSRVLATNIPWTSTHEDMRALFEKFGTVLDVELAMYGKGRNRGMAFVSMGSPEEALAAMENLESYEYEGRTLRMRYAKIKKKKASTPQVFPKMAPTFSLFVSNLPFEAKEKDLKEFFISGGGNVVYAEIIYLTNPRKSAGYGFVAFKSKKEAEDALLAFQDKEFMGRPLRVARSKQFVRPPRSQAAQADVIATETSAAAANLEGKADAADETSAAAANLEGATDTADETS